MRHLLVGLVLAASPLAAQTDWIPLPVEVVLTDKRPTPGEWMFGVDIGFANFIPPEFRERGTRFAVFAERNLTPWLGAQVDVNCSRGMVDATFSMPESEITLCSAVLSGVVPFELTTRIWPYLRLGAGYATWDELATEGFWSIDDSSPTYVIAAGSRYLVGANGTIGLRVDVQRQQTSIRSGSVTHWSFGFGLSVRAPRGK